jgi:lipoic acid synthetase
MRKKGLELPAELAHLDDSGSAAQEATSLLAG